VLLGCPAVRAVMSPVAPAADWMYPAPSAPRPQDLDGHSTSNCFVMTDGERIARLELSPKKPTMMSPADPVVIDGATIDPLAGVKAPL
jgi:hypothetical protein